MNPVNTDFKNKVVNLCYKLKRPDLLLKGKHLFVDPDQDIMAYFSVYIGNDFFFFIG